MVKFPWFSLYAEDWITSPSLVRMTCSQEGAYIRLLCHAWLEPDCGLPRDTEQLKQLARWSPRMKGFEAVEDRFIIHPLNPERYTNRRLYAEWQKTTRISKAHQQAAHARWKKTKGVPPSIPIIASKDRTTKGFTPIGQEISAMANKHLPPV